MKYVTGFLMKWVMIAAVLLIVFSGIYNADIGPVLLISILFAAITYLMDVFVIRSVRNITGTIGDLVVAFLGLWLLGSLLLAEPAFPLIAASAISAILIAVGEWFFHVYMKRRVFGQREGY